jgi:hypothetical protein
LHSLHLLCRTREKRWPLGIHLHEKTLIFANEAIEVILRLKDNSTTKDPTTMMQELIDTLNDKQASLVILHEGKIHSFGGHGVRHLYNLMNEKPELFLEAKLAVKAVGRSAAKMMVEGGITEVWAEYISQQAYDLLRDAGVVVKYDHKVDHATFLDIWRKLGEEAA